MDMAAHVAQALGGAWASGVNAYATCAALGLLGRYGGIELAGNLERLESWWVIGPALAMYTAEFWADKIPWLDSVWDFAHTFVRIPAGALLAASGFSDSGTATQVAALLAGGALAAESHALKTGTRGLINASPEPFSNWIASLAGDAGVLGAVVLAATHPIAFLWLLGAAVVAGAVALYFVWRGVRLMLRRFRGRSGRDLRRTESPAPG